MITRPTYVSPKIRIEDSKVAGRGMFAVDNILKDEIVMVWGGNFYNELELSQFNNRDYLIFQVDDDLYSVEKRTEHEDDYYINHSCDSNLWMADGITFIAKHNIYSGDEVTVDYSLFEDEGYISMWMCNCGSEFCRRTITGKDCLDIDVQNRYANHFSPVVQKRINIIKNNGKK